MMDAVNKQQVFLSTARAYATTFTELQLAPPVDVTKYYTLTITNVAGPPPSFTVTATPIGNQATDGWIAIDSAQTKTSEFAGKW